jgi:hypothetical protein
MAGDDGLQLTNTLLQGRNVLDNGDHVENVLADGGLCIGSSTG